MPDGLGSWALPVRLVEMSQNTFDDRSPLLQVMARCRQAMRCYLNQSWHRFRLPGQNRLILVCQEMTLRCQDTYFKTALQRLIHTLSLRRAVPHFSKLTHWPLNEWDFRYVIFKPGRSRDNRKLFWQPSQPLRNHYSVTCACDVWFMFARFVKMEISCAILGKITIIIQRFL